MQVTGCIHFHRESKGFAHINRIYTYHVLNSYRNTGSNSYISFLDYWVLN